MVTGFLSRLVKSKSTFLYLICTILLIQHLYSQNYEFDWAKRAGGSMTDWANDMAVDASGNVYVTGYFMGAAIFGSTTLTSAGDTDIYIAKINASGNFIWAKQAGGSRCDRGYGIAVDGSGNVYVTGDFSDTAIFGSTTLTENEEDFDYLGDIFIAKIDASGNFVWAKQAGGLEGDVGYDIAIDSHGNVFVTGYFNRIVNFGSFVLNCSNWNGDVFIVKINTSGSYVWAKQAISTRGGYNGSNGMGITVDNNGNIYVTGSYEGTTTFGSTELIPHGTYDIFITKINNSGDFIWTNHAGGSIVDYGDDVTLDGSGNIFVTGDFMGTATFGSITLTSAGMGDFFVAKIDASGNFIWVIQGGSPADDHAEGIACDGSSNVFMTGYFESIATFGSTVLACSGHSDTFITKIDASGNYIWIKQVVGTGSVAADIEANPSGNIFVSGTFGGSILFGSTTVTSAGSGDIFITKMKQAGTGGPDIASNPASGSWGSVNTGTSSGRTFVISNAGNHPLYVTSTAIMGINASEFVVHSGGAPFTLLPGETREIRIRLYPTSSGNKNATLSIASNDPDEGTFLIHLVGIGTGASIPEIASDPALWDYGSLSTGSYSDMTYVISNTGSAALNVTATSITGTDASQFSIQSGGGSFTLAAGATRNIVVRFSPASAGSKSASLSITSNDPDESTFTVNLTSTGTSVSVPDIASDAASWGYGSVNTGSSSDKTFIISNVGTADLNITAVTLTGTNASQFSIQNGGGLFTLSPGGAARNIVVRFNPSASGSKTAELSIESNDPDENPLNISLSGTGTSGGATFSITVDGNKDTFYGTLTGPNDGYLQLRSYAWNDNGVPDNDNDLSAKIWTAWDDTWLYLYEEVKDNTLAGNAVNVWEEDCFEIQVDPQATSAANSIWSTRLTALTTSTAGVVADDDMDNVSGSDKQYARKTISGGYALELAVKWSAITSGSETVTPAAGTLFGAVLNQHDNDGSTKRDATVQWAAELKDASWNTPSYLGTVTFLSDHKLKFNAKNNITHVTNPVPYDGSNYTRTTGVEEGAPVRPVAFGLEQNVPNPFNPSTKITFSTSGHSNARLEVFDLLGRKIRTFGNMQYTPGSHTIEWDGQDDTGQLVACGVYLIVLSNDSRTWTKKMIKLE